MTRRRPDLAPSGWRRRAVVLAVLAVLAAAVAVPVLLTGATTVGHAVAGSRVGGSVPAPSATEVSPICTAPEPSKVLGPAPSLPSDPSSVLVTPSGGVVSFTATSSHLYVNTGSRMVVYTLSGREVRAFSLPSAFSKANEPSQPVVDPSGDVYLASYYGQVIDKFAPTGRIAWSVDPSGGHPVGLFPIGTGSDFGVGVSMVERTDASIELSTASGRDAGTFPMFDDFGYVSAAANGDDLFTRTSSSTSQQNDVGYVETVSPGGSVLSTFGAGRSEGNGERTGSGTQFYYPGQAVAGADGTVYTADPNSTIEATSPEGYLEGSTTLGGSLHMGGSSFALEGDTFFFQGGRPFDQAGDNISAVSLAAVTAYLQAVQSPADSLGWGAGVSTPAAGNYFAPGTTPRLAANFDAWWAREAGHLQLRYSIEGTTALRNESVPPARTVSLPTDARALASVPLTVPGADTAPGPYLVQASLYDTSAQPPARLGTTCVPYTVGASGDALDLSGLPSGAGTGGPADPRGVALNAQLGLNGLRALSFSWSNFLPDCNATAPTAATCGPQAMNFSQAPTSYFQAAALAANDHVSYWVQVSGGDPTSLALVHRGFWAGDVAALVAYYSKVPSGCSPCAPVTNWEPWNEPNDNGYADATTYVRQVLAPFFAAVKSVEPGSSSNVIGGSTLGSSISWWRALVSAGGLSDLDVAAIHPYTGNNDALEEDGMQTQVAQLESTLSGKPLWFTEVGWWSDGDYNFLAQADTVARALIWTKVLGVPVWNYFFDEGSWGNNGVSFSLIQASSIDDYVKPAALAVMQAANELAGRPILGTPRTGIPQAYAAAFGPASGGSTDLVALWTDGLPVHASVTATNPDGGRVPVTVFSEYGEATSVVVASGRAYRLPVDSSVSYLVYPRGDTLSVGPTVPYGPDLALASAGATASASSGDAGAAISGLPVGTGLGWSSRAGDVAPSLTVTWRGTRTVNRVIVDTQANGSVAASLRNYTVSLDEPGGGWHTVKAVTSAYRSHELEIDVPPTAALGVRVGVTQVNFGGYYGGGIPPWWKTSDTETAFLHALQVYGGSASPAQTEGSDLPPLLGAASRDPTTSRRS